ncbi:hypothetical protein [Paraburkholderia sp. C35]|uniref:hypothetical protein n=1 Tax=Paraburkholderia sp. C35 TaxID=2126993 RepID=UPI000D698D29|nr:hypothetical protein [Paraburkholderia sp. C35]
MTGAELLSVIRQRRETRHDAAAQRARIETMNRFVDRPLALLFRYIAMRDTSHLMILICVVAAVACALASRYVIRNLIDSPSPGRQHEALVAASDQTGVQAVVCMTCDG